MDIRMVFTISLLISFPLVPSWAQEPTSQSGPAKWEEDIKAFEESDQQQAPEPGGILFVGSSSIRMWETLARDFPQVPIIRRGFGGCEMADVLFYADRIIHPYKPRLVFIYAGDNDLANKKTPDQVINDLNLLVKKIHEALPETRVVYIAIKPSPARSRLIDKAREVNEGAKKLAAQDEKFTFADIFTPMLGADGMPRKELFLEDMLHLNRQGYDLWREILTPLMK